MIQSYLKWTIRTDSDVEVIDVKLNNRKIGKIGDKNNKKTSNPKLDSNIKNNITSQLHNPKIDQKNSSASLKIKNHTRFKIPDRRKGYI